MKEIVERIGWLSMKYAGLGKPSLYFRFTSVSISKKKKKVGLKYKLKEWA